MFVDMLTPVPVQRISDSSSVDDEQLQALQSQLTDQKRRLAVACTQMAEYAGASNGRGAAPRFMGTSCLFISRSGPYSCL